MEERNVAGLAPLDLGVSRLSTAVVLVAVLAAIVVVVIMPVVVLVAAWGIMHHGACFLLQLIQVRQHHS